MDLLEKFVKNLFWFATAATTGITFTTMGTKSIIADATILFVL